MFPPEMVMPPVVASMSVVCIPPAKVEEAVEEALMACNRVSPVIVRGPPIVEEAVETNPSGKSQASPVEEARR